MFLVSSSSCLYLIHWSLVWVKYEDVVGAAPTGDAPTTSEWSTILFYTKVRRILEFLRYFKPDDTVFSRLCYLLFLQELANLTPK